MTRLMTPFLWSTGAGVALVVVRLWVDRLEGGQELAGHMFGQEVYPHFLRMAPVVARLLGACLIVLGTTVLLRRPLGLWLSVPAALRVARPITRRRGPGRPGTPSRAAR